MALVRWAPNTSSPAWRPLAEFDPLRREFDRVFNAFWSSDSSATDSPQATWLPYVDVLEQDDAYVLQAELPGMQLDDMHIQFHEGRLTIRGERRMEPEGHKGYHRRERAYGAFSRSFMIGPAVEADKIAATYKDGMLEIHMPKTEEARARHIMIQAA